MLRNADALALHFRTKLSYNTAMQEQPEPYAHLGTIESSSGTDLQATPTIAPSGPPILSIEHVSKRFRNVAALRDVSLQIAPGEVFGLLGPNGAGKSTLIKLILGFLYPDKGAIKLFGSTNLTRGHARLGYLPEKPRYHSNFTGREYVQTQAGLSGFGSKDARAVADHSLQTVGLASAADRRISTYSKGMTQRLGLAVVLSASGGRPPDLLVLDEPASGLDPEGQISVRDFILDCKGQGSTVLLCSHQLTEVESICTVVAILRAGRLVMQTRLDVPPKVHIGATPRDGAREIAPHLISYLRSLHPLVSVQGGEKDGEPMLVSLPTGKNVAGAEAIKTAALRAMLDARWDIMSVYVESKDLETLYLQVVKPKKGAKEKKEVEATTVQAAEPSPAQVAEPLTLEPVLARTAEPLPVRIASSNGASDVSGQNGRSTAPLPALDPNIEAYIAKGEGESRDMPVAVSASQGGEGQ